MNSREKALYFIAGLAFAGVLGIVLPLVSINSKSDWINIFVAAGTLGAVIAALYISQRQELLRNKEIHTAGVIALVRISSRLDFLKINCGRIEEATKKMPLPSKTPNWKSGEAIIKGTDIYNTLIQSDEAQFTEAEITHLSYVDSKLAISLSMAVAHLQRYYKYAQRCEMMFHKFRMADYETYITGLTQHIENVNICLGYAHSLKEQSIEKNFSSLSQE